MSYRSQVAVAFHKPSLTKEKLLEAKKILTSLAEGKLIEAKKVIKENDTYLQFYVEFYRWHDRDRDIRDFYSLLKTLDPFSYEFLRTGEECGDVERLGEGDMGLSYLFEVDPESLPLEPY
jgi:hypothetical protein